MPSLQLNAVTMISIKRQNLRPHTDEELQWWMEAYASGAIPEYQMSAWLMAVCWRGMTAKETAALTKHMVLSGNVLKWNDFKIMDGGPLLLVDKHSTGGVGDKVSLVLAPLVAACGVNVPMMAGRGLDHTGGTLDKLESIPGYQVNLSTERFQEIVKTVGCSIVSATKDMVPADRKLYALRDVTGTVSSIPLQTASIVSKKIAEGPQSLVLDVKYGRAAFQSTSTEAMDLAQSMISTAEANHVQPTTAFLTRMDSPIGHAVGNWLELKECLAILRTGRGSPDLLSLVVIQAAQMLLQSGKYDTFDKCVDKAHKTLKSGMAYLKFRKMVEAHGGNVSLLDHPGSYPKAKYEAKVLAEQDGYIGNVDALVVGRVAVDLGAGRRVADEAVEPRAGIWFHKKVGSVVKGGEAVATLYTEREGALEEARERVEAAIECSTGAVEVPQIVTHVVSSKEGVQEFVMPEQLLQETANWV